MQAPLNQTHSLTQICSGKDFTLRGCCTEQSITLQITTNKKTAYQIQIDTTQSEVIPRDLFAKNQQFIDYLQEPQNIRIDTQKQEMHILGKHPIKKLEYIVLLQLKMEEKEAKSPCILEQIIASCSDQSYQITQDNNLRYIVTGLAQQIRQILQSNVKVQIQRIINKIECIGNELSSVHMKTADLLSENADTAKNTARLEQKLAYLRSQVQQNFEHNKLQSKYTHIMSQFIDQYNHKLEKLATQSQKQQEQIKQLRELCKLQNQEQEVMKHSSSIVKKMSDQVQKKKIEERVRAELDKDAKYLKHFVIRGNNITKQVDYIFSTILIGLKPLRERNEFTVRIHQMGILQSMIPCVSVGIVDSKHKNKQSCDTGDNVIEYTCAAKLFEGNRHLKTEGDGFQSGDYIKVKVNIEQGSISWFVEKKLACSHSSKLIKNKEIEWRPYVFMRDKGDSIDWILTQ